MFMKRPIKQLLLCSLHVDPYYPGITLRQWIFEALVITHVMVPWILDYGE